MGWRTLGSVYRQLDLSQPRGEIWWCHVPPHKFDSAGLPHVSLSFLPNFTSLQGNLKERDNCLQKQQDKVL